MTYKSTHQDTTGHIVNRIATKRVHSERTMRYAYVHTEHSVLRTTKYDVPTTPKATPQQQ